VAVFTVDVAINQAAELFVNITRLGGIAWSLTASLNGDGDLVFTPSGPAMVSGQLTYSASLSL